MAAVSKYSMEGYGAFQRLYEGESDRAVIILAGSYLDKYIQEYLARRLVKHKSTDSLFEGYGPLSSLAAKIDLAFAIGLVPDSIRTELHVLRKIRNICAHEDESLRFEDERIRQKCRRLMPALGIRQSDGGKFRQEGARAQFMFSVWWVLIHLQTKAERTSRIRELRLAFEVVKERSRGRALKRRVARGA